MASTDDFSSIGITKEFLEEALNSKWGALAASPIKVDKFVVSKGSAVGDGYTTILLSVDVWLENHQKFTQFQSEWYRTENNDDVKAAQTPDGADTPISLVIKCFPENVARQEFLESTDIFSVELGAYEKVAPNLINFQKDLGVDKIIMPPLLPFISGRALTVSQMKALKETRPVRPLDNYVMMMDIRKHGKFQLRDRFLGFDLDHHKLVMEAHATLHAISWAYKQHKKIDDLRSVYPFLQLKQMVENVKMMDHLVNSHVDMARNIVNNAMDGNVKILKGLDDFVAENKLFNAFMLFYDFDSKFESEPNPAVTSTSNKSGLKFTKDSILKGPTQVIENEEPWMVLLHGDAWSNNMMFRYDEATGRPAQVILLDLQVTREGDPMADIVYALYTGTTHDYREKHLESMLHVYYDTFTKVCDHLSVEPLPGWSWAEFNRRFHRSKMYGLAVGLVLIPITLKSPDLLIDLETMEIPKTEGDLNTKKENGEEKTKEELEKEKNEKNMEGFMEMIRSDNSYEKLNPILIQRLSGLLQSMSDEGIL